MILVAWLLFYTLMAFGLCWIIGGSKISLPIRDWMADVSWPAAKMLFRWFLPLIECPACLGTWVGFTMGIYLWHLGVLLPISKMLQVLAIGCYTTGANYLLGRSTGLIAPP